MSQRPQIQSLLREPLVHFLAGGALLFAWYALVGGQTDEVASKRIVIDDDVIAYLVDRHEATWKRPPSEEELSSLVDGYVRSEILYREGLALGLDRDDALIKRRVRQKLDVLSEELFRREATEEELIAFYDGNIDDYTLPGIVSFQQILLPSDLGSDSAAIEGVLEQLRNGAAPESIGVATLLPAELDEMRLTRVARDFGEPFANAIESVDLGEWTGPVRSGFGFHLVNVTAREPGRKPELDEVRSQVARDLEARQRQDASDRFYEELAATYEVVVETDGEPALVETPGAS